MLAAGLSGLAAGDFVDPGFTEVEEGAVNGTKKKVSLRAASSQGTCGAAIYYESSGDEETLGGRLGISWKLN